MASVLLLTLLLPLAAVTSGLPTMRRAPQACPLQETNILDTVLFVANASVCEDLCTRVEECLFFYYYPGAGGIDQV